MSDRKWFEHPIVWEALVICCAIGGCTIYNTARVLRMPPDQIIKDK